MIFTLAGSQFMKDSFINERSKNGLEISVVFIFAAVSLFGILHHEIWLDEAHHWLLARDSKSLTELWENTRYEGHPLLWNIILYAVTRFTYDPLWMQVSHWAISVAVVTVFIYSSPLPRHWNVLFVFGYFMLFEYAMLSRNYSLLLLFFFLSLRFYARSRDVALGISLFFLSNTHLFGLIIAGWLVIIILLSKPYGAQLQVKKSRSRKLGLVIFGFGALLSILQIAPPGDSPFLPTVRTLFSSIGIERFLAVFLKAFLPIADPFDYHFWNSNLITGISKISAGVVSVILIFVTVLIAAETRKSLILFLGTSISIIAVVIALYPASIVQASRHFGILYIVFVGCIWLASGEEKTRYLTLLSAKTKGMLVTFLLLVQVVAGVMAFYLEIKRPFSESQNVVSFLEQNNFLQRPIITFTAPIPAISSYAQQKTYTMPSGEQAGFFSWGKKEIAVNTTSASDLLKKAEEFVADHGNEGILIVYQPIEETKNTRLLKAFTQGVVRVENYYVYHISTANRGND
jgi:hypothetical protein